MNGERRKPEFGDPDYDAAAFGQDVFGGRFRRAATLGTIASALLVASRFLANPPDIPFPHMTGVPATVAVILIFLFWLFLAIMNWRSYFATRRGSPKAQQPPTDTDHQSDSELRTH